MFLYLARHGEATHSSPEKPSVLTPRGQADVTKMAECLWKRKIKVNAIWHSPAVRAAQTADIYSNILGVQVNEEKKELSPDGDVEQIYNEIIEQKIPALLLVSHIPFLPDLASMLLADPVSPQALSFVTSSMVAFEYTKTWQLLWTMEPATLG
jgi:phosphohistidine phosphatase